MEDYKNYKIDIQNTRVGCLGSSDAAMLRMIDSLGVVPPSFYQRMAVLKGFIPNEEIPQTNAIKFGDETEIQIFEHLHSMDERYVSNPCWVSERYSRSNVSCISHPDIVLKDDDAMMLNIYEVKTSKHSTEELAHEYKAQLYHHFLLGKEKAVSYGWKWKVNVYLVHYNTDGLDLSEAQEFDPSRIEMKKMRFSIPPFNMVNAMNIVNEFLEKFESYYPEENVDANLLPANIYKQFDEMCTALDEIKRLTEGVDTFKAKLFEFMSEKGIKSIKNERFGITRIDPCESVSFDYKRYLDDYAKKYPRKAKKLVSDYKKVVKRKGSVQIRTKNVDK